MKHRMKAAWPLPTSSYTSTTAANAVVTWRKPFDPRAAARRAVRKHADALRRLSR
jgi:hypothetical protein